METESIESIKAKALEKFGKKLEATANIAAIKQWIAEGEPYEEHEEVILFKDYHGITESKSTNFMF